MTLALYMDEHVKSAVTNGLRQQQRALDVLTAQEDGYSQTPDPEVLQRATDLGRILFTQDEDFLAIAHEWQASGQSFAGVVYAHQMALTIGQAIQHLTLVCEVMTAEEVRDTIVYLPL